MPIAKTMAENPESPTHPSRGATAAASSSSSSIAQFLRPTASFSYSPRSPRKNSNGGGRRKSSILRQLSEMGSAEKSSRTEELILRPKLLKQATVVESPPQTPTARL